MRTSNGGWNSLVVEDTDSPMTSFPTVSANAARARRKNNRILATLPPLTKTLDKEVLDEMRKIIHRYFQTCYVACVIPRENLNFSQSLKRSADFELCRASDIEKLARTSTSMEASLSTSQIKETVDENMNVVEEITEDSPEEKHTEVKEELKKDKTPEPQKSATPAAQNTVTVVAQIENDTKQKSYVEQESEYETDTDESEVTVYNRPVEKPKEVSEEAKDENPKKPSKTVTIDDEKNEEKVYRLDLKRWARLETST